MRPIISNTLEVSFVVLAFTLFALIVWGVKKVCINMGTEPIKARNTTLRTGFALILWFAAVLAFSAAYLQPGEGMTFEGRNFDELVGLTALPIAYLVMSGKLKSKAWIIAWNIFGLILLLNIVSVAILSTPLPFRIFTEGPPNTMIAYFPFVWLPDFVVPVAFAMHLFSIQQTLQKK